MRIARWVLAAALAGAAIPVAGCASAKYSLWEMFGKEKRDLLRSELAGLVDDQTDAKAEFATALDRIKALTDFDGGDLEEQYDDLKAAYDDAKSSADAIDGRIAEIEDVASDLFEEWEAEIGQMSTRSLAEDSRRKLADTRSRYRSMHATMAASRERMKPALRLLNDQVLYLKHNLNAAAVGALGGSMREIEESIAALQRSIESSIREAESFLETLP